MKNEVKNILKIYKKYKYARRDFSKKFKYLKSKYKQINPYIINKDYVLIESGKTAKGRYKCVDKKN